MNFSSVREDWPTWIIALALAVGLYAYVSKTEPIERQTRAVPLVISQSSEVAVANALPPEVTMRVEGPKDFVKEYLDTEPVAHLNLANATAGMGQELRFTPRPEPTYNQLRVTFNPPVHLVDLEERATKTLKPGINALNELPEHLDLTSHPEGIPNEVKVTGPVSSIREVSEVVFDVDLSKFEGVTQRDVTFYARDDEGIRVPFVTVDPPQVQVRFLISRKEESLSLPVLPILSGGPAPGWMVREISVEPVAVEVEGPGRELAKYKRLQTDAIDIEGIASDQSYTVKVDLPKGASITLNPKTVTVRVVVEQQSGVRTFSGIPIALNDQTANRTYQLQPAELQVTLRGDIETLDDMLEGSIRGSMRVGTYDVGSHTVSTDSILLTIPQGVVIEKRSPAQLTLEVRESGSEPPPAPE